MDASLALDPGAVHVWLTDPRRIDAATLATYDALLTHEERVKVRAFAFDTGRRECLVARALLRTTLSRYAPRPPESWRFITGPHGKPSLAPGVDSDGFEFNLSHTTGLIACAVTRGPPIGVDVEWLDRRGDTVAVADRHFAPPEVTALSALPAHRQRERFFTYWCLKEAYIKATGKGLATPLDQFWFNVDGPGPVTIAFDPRLADDPDAWQFAHLRPTPQHILALAVRRAPGADLALEVCFVVPSA